MGGSDGEAEGWRDRGTEGRRDRENQSLRPSVPPSRSPTLAHILPARAADPSTADRPALLFESAVYTYADLEALSNRVAQTLISYGVGAGDVVCQVVGSRPELIVNLFGILETGATYAPLNPSLTEGELAVQLRDCRPRLVIVDGERVEQAVRRAAGELPECRVRTLAELEAEGRGRPTAPIATVDNHRNLHDLHDLRGIATPHPDAPALLFYTSGTTGRPKGVQLSHRNVLVNARQVLERTGVGPDDRLLVVMPIFHVNGLCNQVVLPLLAGASIALRPRFVAEEFWPSVARYRPTYFTAVPTILGRILDGPPPPPGLDRSALRFARTGAAPLSVELQRRFEERFDLPIIASYGLSEATCTVTMNPPTTDGRRLGSVGTPLAGLDVRVLGPDGAVQPPSWVGEVAVRGPTLMLGYRGLPAATAEAIPDGWLRTGDLGYLDADGYLYLTDRKKDVIIRGGENVSAREVEEVLHAHPAVVEAAVVGAPDPEYGERVVAFVAPRVDTPPPTTETLLAHCRARLARFKVPAEIELLAELPKNAVGKIAKQELRERVQGAGCRLQET